VVVGGGGLVGGGGHEWVVYLMRVSYVCQRCNVRADTCRAFHLTTVRDGDSGVLSSTHAGAANSNDSQGARRAAVSGECGVCRFARACSTRLPVACVRVSATCRGALCSHPVSQWEGSRTLVLVLTEHWRDFSTLAACCEVTSQVACLIAAERRPRGTHWAAHPAVDLVIL
jgi:hypothetical protein